MFKYLLPALITLGTAAVAQTAPPSQSPDASAPPAQSSLSTFQSDYGVSYEYPSDWEVVDSKPILPAAQLRATESASSQTEKKAAGCVEIVLMLWHGSPRSVIMIEALPFDCAGLVVKPGDLPGVASGIAKGLQKTFDVSDPIYGAYRLGTHDFSIERAQAVSKDHPDLTATLETTCSILKKSLVCWMAVARDEDVLKKFEEGHAALEGDAPASLVPPGAFKPIHTLPERKK